MRDGPLALADWRRRTFDLYRDIRDMGDADSEKAWVRWHETRSRLYRGHTLSPLSSERRRSFEQIPIFPYRHGWRFEVFVEPFEGPSFDVDLGTDGCAELEPIARTTGLDREIGQELTLYWIEGYGGGLFLPFADTNPNTYGGGRYIYDTIKGADLGYDDLGFQLIIDFNFAYSPSCAWNDAYVCPLAPPENRLKVSVPVGEKTPPPL